MGHLSDHTTIIRQSCSYRTTPWKSPRNRQNEEFGKTLCVVAPYGPGLGHQGGGLWCVSTWSSNCNTPMGVASKALV